MTSEDTKISNGPSKFDLMVSLFDSNYSHHRPVMFNIETDEIGKSAPLVIITMIARSGGSGEEWKFEGQVLEYNTHGHIIARHPVVGHYSTQFRKGGWRMTSTSTR